MYTWDCSVLAEGATAVRLCVGDAWHSDHITDVVVIAERESVATASLDGRVCLWAVLSECWSLRADFKGHRYVIQYARSSLKLSVYMNAYTCCSLCSVRMI
jgi:hypothetical protein